MSILVLGTEHDQHIKAILHNVSKRTTNYKFVDISKDISSIRYQFNMNPSILYGFGNDFSSFKTVYWRYPVEEIITEKQYSISELCDKQEIWNFFFPLNTVGKTRCINSLLTNLIMENKIFQLNLATEVGLLYPSTLISSNYDDIIDFYHLHQDCVVKSLGLRWSENSNTQAKTRKLDLTKLLIKKTLPCIYQKLILKQSDLRIYVIGDDIIPIEIKPTSKLDDETIDWREAARTARYSYKEVDLSDALKERLLTYHRAANLEYAAYDFIVDNNKQAYFLECNPNGNWLFLPSQICERIVDSFTNTLLEEKAWA